MAESTKDLVDIEQMAKQLERAVHTVRQWIREDALPKDLKPHRLGGRKKIYWKKSQVRGMKRFARERSARRGWQH